MTLRFFARDSVDVLRPLAGRWIVRTVEARDERGEVDHIDVAVTVAVAGITIGL